MWIFLATEALIFGTLIMLYQLAYYHHRSLFQAAAKEMQLLHGTINTVLLLTSSFLVAFSHLSGKRRWTMLAMLLGIFFIALTGLEYYDLMIKGNFPTAFVTLEAGKKLYFTYFTFLTLLHTSHVLIGVLLLGASLWWFGKERENYREGVGLYWHFVDLVWI